MVLVVQQHVVFVAVELGPHGGRVEVRRHGRIGLEARGRDGGAVVAADLAARLGSPLAHITERVGWTGGEWLREKSKGYIQRINFQEFHPRIPIICRQVLFVLSASYLSQ